MAWWGRKRPEENESRAQVTSYSESGWSYLTAGSTIDNNGSLAIPTVWACVRLISSVIGSMPADVIGKNDDGSRVELDPPAWLEEPAQGLTRGELIEQFMVSLLLHGNAYAVIERVAGKVTGVIPLHPSRVTPVRENGKIHYLVRDGEGRETRIGYDKLLHVKGLTLPGQVTGVSVIEYCNGTVTLAKDLTEHGGKVFKNAAVPSGVIKIPADTNAEQRDRIRDNWRRSTTGDLSGGVAVLSGGADYTAISLRPDQAQYLESRQFQVPEICRMFGVPPHLVADATNSTSWGSGLSEQNQQFVQYGLMSWITRLESALTRLVREELGGRVSVKLNMDSALRGSPRDRAYVSTVLVQNGILTVNEARALEDYKPIEGGDMPLRVSYTMPILTEEEDLSLRPVEEQVKIKKDLAGDGKVKPWKKNAGL